MDVEFANVGLSRGGAKILDGVTFSTVGESIFLIFGESGSGKTSLLRLVNHLHRRTFFTPFGSFREVRGGP